MPGRAPSSRCRRAPPLATAVRDDHAGTVPAPLATLRPALPGIVVALAVGIVATVVGTLVPVVGGPVPAVVLGVLVGWLVRRRTEGELGNLAPGVKFASSRVLQAAVVLLGAQLSIGAVLRIGAETLPVMLTTLVVCLVGAWLLGRALRVSSTLRTLIGVGTGICGASAIAAVTPVIGAVGADVAYAMSTIFLCNIAAVFLFPLLGHALGLSQHAFGVFAGTAVNDTSSVVATATVYGRQATDTAVVVKLVRTLMIIPIVIGLAGLEARRTARTQAAVGDAAGRAGSTTRDRRPLVVSRFASFRCRSGRHDFGGTGFMVHRDEHGGRTLVRSRAAPSKMDRTTRARRSERTPCRTTPATPPCRR